MIKPGHILTILLLALSLTACATTGERAAPNAAPKTRDGFAGAMTQPLTDLSLMREVSPAVLVEAAAGPYALPEGLDCAMAAAAIGRLETALGPDVDKAPAKRPGAGSALLVDALRGAVALPYRGLIRKMSGAETRDRLRAQAVLAGMVRRGFLKGWMRANACPAAPVAPATPVAAP